MEIIIQQELTTNQLISFRFLNLSCIGVEEAEEEHSSTEVPDNHSTKLTESKKENMHRKRENRISIENREKNTMK